MIHIIDAAKSYHGDFGTRVVLRPTRLSIPTHRRIGVLGRNGAGKSTLLKMIAGVEQPDQGRIVSEARLSWPLGFSGGIHPDLTGTENTAFAARIYGADVDAAIRFVYDFAELGDYMHMPVRTYSQGMKARLSFGISMAIDFDCYLIDELTAVGDFVFQQKCRRAFMERAERSGLLFVSHRESNIRQYCEMAMVLYDGYLIPFEDLEEGIRFYLQVSRP